MVCLPVATASQLLTSNVAPGAVASSPAQPAPAVAQSAASGSSSPNGDASTTQAFGRDAISLNAGPDEKTILGVPEKFIRPMHEGFSYEQQGDNIGLMTRLSGSSHSHTILIITATVNIIMAAAFLTMAGAELTRRAIPDNHRNDKPDQRYHLKDEMETERIMQLQKRQLEDYARSKTVAHLPDYPKSMIGTGFVR